MEYENGFPDAIAAGEAPATGDLAAGDAVGPYVIVQRIAVGGCGAVYDARPAGGGPLVAVKVLHSFLVEQPKMVERFLREVELVNMLRHPAIVTIHQVSVLPDRRPYYVMEHLGGGTLDDVLRERGRLSPEEALEVLAPVCAALEAAHAAGVVHRDVKASNIAFDEERRAIKLLDFGIAKLLVSDGDPTGLTTVGRRLGTPNIMAPEQLLGRPVDARVDVYALGVLLFRMLTGKPPFDGKTPGTLARQHLEEPPPRPSRVAKVTPALDAVVLRCLEKLPERRFPSASRFCAALSEALGKRDDGPVSGRVERARGVAVHFELPLGGPDDELDDALADDMGAVLDRAEEHLRLAGYTVAQATGNAVLGVRLLTGDEAAARAEAEETARALAATAVSPEIRPRVAVHAGEVLVRPGPEPEIAGGALLSTSAWPRPDAGT